MSEDALIGNTGFIGGTLLRARNFDSCFNSGNIETMRNRGFRTVVCAGARAEKWKANREPEIDRAGIDALCDVLRTVKAERFVLISTVDVFADPENVDELSEVTLEDLHAYGRNRRHLETFVVDRFPTIILRLPGVYGHGLRKNVIHD
ncbi:MAG: NAD-dependent epimerase/dehydratase family protein, partial [Gemmatimonadaceae bacterium]